MRETCNLSIFWPQADIVIYYILPHLPKKPKIYYRTHCSYVVTHFLTELNQHFLTLFIWQKTAISEVGLKLMLLFTVLPHLLQKQKIVIRNPCLYVVTHLISEQAHNCLTSVKCWRLVLSVWLVSCFLSLAEHLTWCKS